MLALEGQLKVPTKTPKKCLKKMFAEFMFQYICRIFVWLVVFVCTSRNNSPQPTALCLQ